MSTVHSVSIALALLLCACVSPPPPEDSKAAPATPGVCHADGLAKLVGQRSTAVLAEKARVDSGSTIVRVIMPGMPVTMDYRAERLNMHVDDAGVITQLTCG